MTDTDRATERALRVAAIAKHDGACEVLADFYDERGQPSRAQLWRNPQRDERCAGERDRTVIHTLVRASPVDPRRDALIWIYSLADRSLAQIGTQFKLSRERIRGIVNRIDCKVHFDAARADRLHNDPVMRRLREAGAVRSSWLDGTNFLAVELPPDTWPTSRSAKKP